MWRRQILRWNRNIQQHVRGWTRLPLLGRRRFRSSPLVAVAEAEENRQAEENLIGVVQDNDGGVTPDSIVDNDERLDGDLVGDNMQVDGKRSEEEDDSVVAMEVDNQDVAASRHAEQPASKEATRHAGWRASKEAAAAAAPRHASAAAVPKVCGSKYMGLCRRNIEIGEYLLQESLRENLLFQPRGRKVRPKSRVVHNATVGLLFCYTDMRIFFKLSKSKGFQQTYIVDFDKFKKTTKLDSNKFSPIQKQCIAFILEYETLKADPNSLHIEVHHLAMRSLGGGNDLLNLLPLEIWVHINIHLAYAMLFENYEIQLAASFMMHRGGIGGSLDEDMQVQVLEEIQTLFGDDGAINEIATIRYELSKRSKEAHQRYKDNLSLSEDQQVIISKYNKMQKACQEFRLSMHDMANKLSTGNLTSIDSKKDYKMLQHLVTTASAWTMDRSQAELMYPGRLNFQGRPYNEYAKPIACVCAGTTLETIGKSLRCHVCFWKLFNIRDLREQADAIFKTCPTGVKGQNFAREQEFRNGKQLIHMATGGCKKCGVRVCKHCWDDYYCRDAKKYLDFRSSTHGYTLLGKKLYFNGICRGCNKDKYTEHSNKIVSRHYCF